MGPSQLVRTIGVVFCYPRFRWGASGLIPRPMMPCIRTKLPVPENTVTSFPEINTTFKAVISGGVPLRRWGAMGLSAASDWEDDRHVGPCTSLNTLGNWTRAGGDCRKRWRGETLGTEHLEGASHQEPGIGPDREIAGRRAAECC